MEMIIRTPRRPRRMWETVGHRQHATAHYLAKLSGVGKFWRQGGGERKRIDVKNGYGDDRPRSTGNNTFCIPSWEEWARGRSWNLEPSFYWAGNWFELFRWNLSKISVWMSKFLEIWVMISFSALSQNHSQPTWFLPASHSWSIFYSVVRAHFVERVLSLGGMNFCDFTDRSEFFEISNLNNAQSMACNWKPLMFFFLIYDPVQNKGHVCKHHEYFFCNSVLPEPVLYFLFFLLYHWKGLTYRMIWMILELEEHLEYVGFVKTFQKSFSISKDIRKVVRCIICGRPFFGHMHLNLSILCIILF